MPPPAHPVAAVTHADPYPYYAELVAHRPLYRDAALGLWVASSADVVTSVMTSERCRVRPGEEPVPRALLGSPAGDIFRQMVRMNDGPGHAALKPAVARSLETVHGERAAEQSRTWARALSGELSVNDFAFHLPVYVVAGLLGVSPTGLREAALWTGDFVWCFSPVATQDQVERGKAAAARLWDLVRSLRAAKQAEAADGLLAALHDETQRGGRGGPDVVVANAIGFLFQAYEATAGLIGNTLLALAAHRDVRARLAGEPRLLRPVLEEVLRHDPPIQNTRRFVARAGPVAGQPMNEGDAILVVLAAANRDPLANPEPDHFDVFRSDRRVFTFGAGGHACPGEHLATTIAAAGVAELLRAGRDPAQLPTRVSYRPSANARVPIFENA
jgi:cytochrome P450